MTDQNENQIKDMAPQMWNKGAYRVIVRPQTQEEERRFTMAVNTFLAEWVRQRISQEEHIYATAKD